jgi:hypothetical protein
VQFVLFFLLQSIFFSPKADSLFPHSQKIIDATYIFNVKLENKPVLSPDCGIIAWATAIKYKVLNTDYPNFKGDYILILEPCPELKGKFFFSKGMFYKIKASKNSSANFGYSIINNYKKEKLPILWSRSTELLK